MAARVLFASLQKPAIIAAPMAGGANTPLFVTEVIRCGGIGSFGFAYSTPEKIEADLLAVPSEIRVRVNANFFIFPRQEECSFDQSHAEAARHALEGLCQRDVQIVVPHAPGVPEHPNLEEQLEPIWRLRPGLLTFHFGVPPAEIISKAKELNIPVGVSATNLKEARKAESSRADFIIAQGYEAGGHRGTHNKASVPLQEEKEEVEEEEDEQLSMLQLVALLRSQLREEIPIVAAGGIMNGTHIASALNVARADAVQCGTAFLTTHECGVSDVHKRYLLEQGERGSAMTNAFSGRMARGIVNEFILHFINSEAAPVQQHPHIPPVLPFPHQYKLTSPIRAKASAEGNGELQALWCGSNYTKCKSQSVEDLIRSLREEFRETVHA